MSYVNHYDFLNVYAHKSNDKLDRLMKELTDNEEPVRINLNPNLNFCVYRPLANLNALFLFRHSAQDFDSVGMLLRKFTDWYCFLKKQGLQLDWTMGSRSTEC